MKNNFNIRILYIQHPISKYKNDNMIDKENKCHKTYIHQVKIPSKLKIKVFFFNIKKKMSTSKHLTYGEI